MTTAGFPRTLDVQAERGRWECDALEWRCSARGATPTTSVRPTPLARPGVTFALLGRDSKAFNLLGDKFGQYVAEVVVQ